MREDVQLEKKLGTEMEVARGREEEKSARSHLPEGLPLFLPHYWMTGWVKGPCHWERGGALAPIEREGTVSGSLSGERIYGRLRNGFINRWAESRKKSELR